MLVAAKTALVVIRQPSLPTRAMMTKVPYYHISTVTTLYMLPLDIAPYATHGWSIGNWKLLE